VVDDRRAAHADHEPAEHTRPEEARPGAERFARTADSKARDPAQLGEQQAYEDEPRNHREERVRRGPLGQACLRGRRADVAPRLEQAHDQRASEPRGEDGGEQARQHGDDAREQHLRTGLGGERVVEEGRQRGGR
jgi:hypothetical protein